jgi:hypothetical protein
VFLAYFLAWTLVARYLIEINATERPVLSVGSAMSIAVHRPACLIGLQHSVNPELS